MMRKTIIRKTNNSYLFIILLSFLVFFTSCGHSVTITRNYIYTTSWASGEYQGFRISKIKLLDSTVSVFSKNFNKYYLDEHVVDSVFCFGAGGNNNNTVATDRMPKVFFNKESIYYVWYKCQNITQTYKTIGLLELNTWYLITGLHGTEDFYVYIDNKGGSHTYSLGPTNW